MLTDLTTSVPWLLAKPSAENKEGRFRTSLELSPVLVINVFPRQLC